MSPQPNWEVLFVSHKYPPGTGGMEKQSYELIEGVAKHCKVHRLVFRKDEESILKFFALLQKRMLKILQEHPNIRIIHFNDALIGSIALFHKGYPGYRKVVTIHGLDVVFPWTYFQKKVLPKFDSYFDQIIAVSQATANEAIFRGISADKVRVIPNGVDLQLCETGQQQRDILQQHFPQIHPGQQYMLTLGRPVKRKGFSWLLKEVIPHLPSDFKLYMVGPFQQRARGTEKLMRLLPTGFRRLLNLFLGFPTDEPAIRKLLQQPDIAQRVQHLGKVPLSDLKLLLAHSSAFLMPNIKVLGDMEGFGLVCLEASLSGSLVIAAGIEGITDAISPGKNGLLLPSGDPTAWIDQLQDVLRQTSSYAEKAQSYQAYSKANYSWEKMSLAYFQTLQALATVVGSKD